MVGIIKYAPVTHLILGVVIELFIDRLLPLAYRLSNYSVPTLIQF